MGVGAEEGTESAGKMIRRYREGAGLTQEDVALALKVSPSAPSQWETGRALPSRVNAIKLDRLLNAGGAIVLGLGYSEDPPTNNNGALPKFNQDTQPADGRTRPARRRAQRDAGGSCASRSATRATRSTPA